MKKLSEILELAMPFYIERIKSEIQEDAIHDYGYPLGSMCQRLIKPLIRNQITEDEHEFAKAKIKKQIKGKLYLGQYLESKGRKTTALAQIRFYQKWIKELKAKGE